MRAPLCQEFTDIVRPLQGRLHQQQVRQELLRQVLQPQLLPLPLLQQLPHLLLETQVRPLAHFMNLPPCALNGLDIAVAMTGGRDSKTTDADAPDWTLHSR